MEWSYQILDNGVKLVWDSDWKNAQDIINNAKTMQEMKALDSDAINNKGISSLWLMENAARSVVDEVTEYIDGNGLPHRVTIVCGAGNNGGDGVACAYMLIDRGYRVKAYLCGRREKMTPDELEMERRLIDRGGVLVELFDGNATTDACIINNVDTSNGTDTPNGMDALRSDIEQSECCIDALFGVGISRDIASPYDKVIEIINESKYIVSCDIPSGVNGDTGKVMGISVRADVTVTFSYVKKGLLTENINECCKSLVVVPIGLP